jgi:hypothetical protein
LREDDSLGSLDFRPAKELKAPRRLPEPCCGAGAISNVLGTHGYKVVSTDIADTGFGTITNPPYGEAATDAGQPRSSKAMLKVLRHALALTATVNGQLALLVRLQWIAGDRVAEVMTAAPFAAVVVLTPPLVRRRRANQCRPAPSCVGRVRPFASARTSATLLWNNVH